MKLTEQVIDELKHAVVEGNCLWLVRQLDRKLYVAVNKALECLGGKWDRRARAHVFEGDPWDSVCDAVTTGEVVDAKKEFQYFPTPFTLARRMVEAAEIQPGHRILEPSAGTGNILSAIHEAHEAHYDTLQIVAVEINPNMSQGNEVFGESRCADFLQCNGDLGLFDRIVMNPPFSKGQDIAHVQHAYHMLGFRGRMVALTSPGWQYRTDKKHAGFRRWVDDVGAAVEEIPAGAFKESGTDIRTVMLVVNK